MGSKSKEVLIFWAKKVRRFLCFGLKKGGGCLCAFWAALAAGASAARRRISCWPHGASRWRCFWCCSIQNTSYQDPRIAISPTCLVLAIATIFLAIARTEVGSPTVLCGRRVGSRRWARCNRKPNCVKMPPHNPYQRCLYGVPDTPPEPPVERYPTG